jgi:hypothetical protein
MSRIADVGANAPRQRSSAWFFLSPNDLALAAQHLSEISRRDWSCSAFESSPGVFEPAPEVQQQTSTTPIEQRRQ